MGLIVDSALLCVLMVLCSPTCWIATYNALLFPVFLTLALCIQRPAAIQRLPIAVGLAMIAMFSTMTHAKFWHLLGIHHLKGESYVYLVVMIFPLLGLSIAWSLWHYRLALAQQPH